MKKLILCALIIFVAFSSVGYADEYDYLKTDGVLNGKALLEQPPTTASAYVLGLMDGISSTNPGFWTRVYPNMTNGDIVSAVKKYYKNNPRQRHRSIIDVVLSGAK